jgi:imidazolonepropionase-like amidohydrolase
VAAHAHGAAGIYSALVAGVSTIEHGSYFNSTLIAMAKEMNIVYVPTVTIQQTFNQTVKPSEYDDLQWAKGQEVT